MTKEVKINEEHLGTMCRNLAKRIKELEQENARLKLELEALDGQIPWKDIKDKSEVLGKLTEAKEIIKKLYSHVFLGMGFMEINDYNVQKAEAEQFIKE